MLCWAVHELVYIHATVGEYDPISETLHESAEDTQNQGRTVSRHKKH